MFSTFIAGLAAFHAWDRIKIRRIAEQQFNDKNKSFGEFLRRQSEPLDTRGAGYDEPRFVG